MVKLDLTGQRFGKLTVISSSCYDPKKRTSWLCKCDCGHSKVILTLNLRNGNTTSCGCNNRTDLTGMVFGRLTVLNHIESINYSAYWNCLCECGNNKRVASGNLLAGTTRSCGCYMRERIRETHVTHGDAHAGKITPEYRTWCGIKDRCCNKNLPSYHNYGGRGITVYEGWVNDYPSFLEHVGRRPSKFHSLDRLDNESGYCPGNVAWRTRRVQNNNKRNNIKFSQNGVTKTLGEWCESLNINYSTIYARIFRNNFTFEEALNPSLRSKKGRTSTPSPFVRNKKKPQNKQEAA